MEKNTRKSELGLMIAFGTILILAIIALAVIFNMGSNTNEEELLPTANDVTISIKDETSIYGEPIKENFDFEYEIKNDSITVSKAQLESILTINKEEGANVGTYKITGTINDSNITADIIPGEYTITKATYDMSNVHFDNKEVPIMGKTHVIEISGELPDGVTVDYENNEGKEAGSYVAVAHFHGDETNYYEIPDMMATLTILAPTSLEEDKAEEPTSNSKNPKTNGRKPATQAPTTTKTGNTNDTSQSQSPDKDVVITINKTNSVYGEQDAALTYTYEIINTTLKLTKADLDKCITLKREAGTTVGDYTITGTCSRKDFKVEIIPAVYTITRATYDMSSVKFENKRVTHDGKQHDLHITGTLPDDVTVSYEGNGKSAVGKYKVIAHFSGDYLNYYAIPDKVAYLTIEKKGPSIELDDDDDDDDDGDSNGSGTTTPPEGPNPPKPEDPDPPKPVDPDPPKPVDPDPPKPVDPDPPKPVDPDPPKPVDPNPPPSGGGFEDGDEDEEDKNPPGGGFEDGDEGGGFEEGGEGGGGFEEGSEG